MKKFHLFLVWAFLGMLTFNACSDDDNDFPTPVAVTIESNTGRFSLIPGESLTLTAQVADAESTTFKWYVNNQPVSTEASYTFEATELGNYEITVNVATAGNQGLASTDIEVHGKYKYGTFVLNEGKTGGFLNFISPDGVLTDNVFRLENDGKTLSSYAQDLYIKNNKLYIIAQGFTRYPDEVVTPKQLIIANAETLQMEAAYEGDDLGSTLGIPTHIAVPQDDYVYLRSNTGLHLFRPSTRTLTSVEGVDRAATQPMAIANNHVFAIANGQIVSIQEKSTQTNHTITLDNDALSVIPSNDGNLWAIDKKATLYKVDATSFSVTDKHEMSSEVQACFTNFWNNGTYLTAKGDTLILSGESTQVYRHIFSANRTEKLFDAVDYAEGHDATYQSAAIHPLTGDIYLTTAKSVGWSMTDFRINLFHISPENTISHTEYKKAEDGPELFSSPAGIFFTDNFK